MAKKVSKKEMVKNLKKHMGGPEEIVAHMMLTLSTTGRPCDVLFRDREPAINVKIDERIALALMYGAGAEKLQEMSRAIRLSNGDTVRFGDIWMILPMPNDGFSDEELADVDLAKGDEVWGPKGETVREMIKNLYHCKTEEDEEKYLRRYLAS